MKVYSQGTIVHMAEWLGRVTAKNEVYLANAGILPGLKHAYGEGDWLLKGESFLCLQPHVYQTALKSTL